MGAEDLDATVTGIRAGDRLALSRAITLVESVRGVDRDAARELVDRVMPSTGGAVRIGISGSPGAGKSTFIDALGALVLEHGHRPAVLAVDPSSSISGGSVLGDKTQMARLAGDGRAFVRPSPSADAHGGVARRTREAMLLCEAAGYDVVLVETVGVGQAETDVAGMVDFFVLLVLPGAGDELQGIKKGIVEMADLIVVNKADGQRLPLARTARSDYAAALRLVRHRIDWWMPEVLAASARDGTGIAEVWAVVERFRELAATDDRLDRRRRQQRTTWMRSLIEEELIADFDGSPAVRAARAGVEARLAAGEIGAATAAAELLAAYWQKRN